MIIDVALANASKYSQWVHPKVLKRVTAAAYQAKRLKIDAESSALLGRFMDQCLDLIIDNRQFAMPLYDVMYVEFDTQAMYSENGLTGFATGPIKLKDKDADTAVGFLFDHRTVYTVAMGDTVPGVIMPVFNYINPRGSFELPGYGVELPAYDFNDTGVQFTNGISHAVATLGIAFGSTLSNPKLCDTDGNLLPNIQTLHKEIVYYYGGSVPAKSLSMEAHKKTLTEIVGDVRNMYAILLWLNSLPHTIKYSNMPAGHRLIRGKRVAMSAHNVVTIHMKGTVQVRNLWQRHIKHRDSPRRHDVRGFWRHRGGVAQGCGHVWPATPDKHHKFVCAKCSRERWWVNAHQRGDESKGFVSKEYRAEI